MNISVEIQLNKMCTCSDCRNIWKPTNKDINRCGVIYKTCGLCRIKGFLARRRCLKCNKMHKNKKKDVCYDCRLITNCDYLFENVQMDIDFIN